MTDLPLGVRGHWSRDLGEAHHVHLRPYLGLLWVVVVKGVAMGVGGFLGVCFTRDLLQAGYPLKLYFKIPCVVPALRQIFPVPIYIICEYYIHRTDLADLSSFWEKNDFFLRQLLQYPLLLESEHVQLELTKFPVFSLCLDKIPCVLIIFPNSQCFP